MNATYWEPIAGQIAADETVSTGHSTAREARKAAEALGNAARVVCLKTIEHELPSNNPACQPFHTTRYCVVVKQ